MGTLEAAGFELLPDVVSGPRCAELAGKIEALAIESAGSRTLLEEDWCRHLASTMRQHPRIAPLLPDRAVAVQCTLFDKTPARNWQVTFHQDVAIPVRARVNSPSCSAWSEKQGALFVQPPVAVLSELVAMRLHLDDCGPDNGPLRLVPGSHRLGRLSTAQAIQCRDELGESPCIAARGSALIMRPLLLHASSKARANAPRRVLHFLMGPPQLPLGLEWHRAV